MRLFILCALAALALTTGVWPEEAKSMMQLSSPAIQAGAKIPRKFAYKGEGDNVSPPLNWSGAPAGTKELALLCEDPDAPRPTPWVHWVLYKIPAGTSSLAEDSVPKGAVEGKNDYGELGWGGPFPPKGDQPHRYQFTVYALDQAVRLAPGATKGDMLKALQGHILAQGVLEALYQR